MITFCSQTTYHDAVLNCHWFSLNPRFFFIFHLSFDLQALNSLQIIEYPVSVLCGHQHDSITKVDIVNKKKTLRQQRKTKA